MQTLQLMIKPASDSCNLRCSYCFYHNIAQNRSRPNRGMMSIGTFETIAKKALACAQKMCTFSFQGGEPALAGLDFYRQALACIRDCNTRRIPVSVTFQTNGTLITQEWADFLAAERILTGVSLDGPAEFHNRYRTDTRHKASYAAVLRGIDCLKRSGAQFNILSVVTDASARHAHKMYDFFKKRRFEYLQFIPCLAPLDAGAAEPLLTSQAYGTFLCELFDCWHADIMRGTYVSIRQFDNYVHMLHGYPPESCDMGGRCSVQHVVEADGNVYPCDFYCLDRYLLGNILTDSFEQFSARRQELGFIEESQIHTERCLSCRWYAICRGGCKRHRLMTGDETLQTNYFCQSFQLFFDRCADRLLRAARLTAAPR